MDGSGISAPTCGVYHSCTSSDDKRARAPTLRASCTYCLAEEESYYIGFLVTCLFFTFP